MRHLGAALVVTLCLDPLADGAAAAPVIEHQPVRCIVAGMHPWLQARAEGAVAVVARFRPPEGRDWYSVRLTEDEDGWVGGLPKPGAALRGFVYYLEATDASAGSSRTAEHSVRVVKDESACGADGVGQSISDADVVAESPSGRPGLPKGFDGPREPSAGGKVGVFSFSPRTSALAALAVGGVVAGVAVAAAKSSPPHSSVELVASSPPNGSVISMSSFALSVRVRLRSTRDIGPGEVVLGLRPSDFAGWCVSLFGSHPGLSADDAVDVTLDRLFPFQPCTPPFTTQQARVDVRGPSTNDEFGSELPLSYSFVP